MIGLALKYKIALNLAAKLFFSYEQNLHLAGHRDGEQRSFLRALGVNAFDKIDDSHLGKFSNAFKGYAFRGDSPNEAAKKSFDAFSGWARYSFDSITEICQSSDLDDRKISKALQDMFCLDTAPLKSNIAQSNVAAEQIERNISKVGLLDGTDAKHFSRIMADFLLVKATRTRTAVNDIYRPIAKVDSFKSLIADIKESKVSQSFQPTTSKQQEAKMGTAPAFR
ncbi:MAG: hypothetical protein P8O06_07315 [Porticoccaceae bacterium]|nr:hypothetical protein [Porticoccaceae bacterium]